MLRTILFLVALVCVANAFQLQFGRPKAFRTPRVLFAEEKKAHETMIDGAAPYGSQFFAADVGVPTKDEDFGGGDVGGNDYVDALYHAGPRGKNKPKITDNAVVKVPNMATVERGFKDYRNPDGTMASEFKGRNFREGPWSKEEDEKLIKLVGVEKDGTRGRWVRISTAMTRTVADCTQRWNFYLAPKEEKNYKSILKDNVVRDPTKKYNM